MHSGVGLVLNDGNGKLTYFIIQKCELGHMGPNMMIYLRLCSNAHFYRKFKVWVGRSAIRWHIT